METPDGESKTPLEGYLPRIESVLKGIIQHGGFHLSFNIHKGKIVTEGMGAPNYVVDFTGPDSELLLQQHAALLDALEYLVLKAARLEESLFGRIAFDCQEWRWMRAQELQMAARVAAERVIESGDPFALNPMNARERRIVHLALKDEPKVRTLSEGFGPERRVVIHRSATSAPSRGTSAG